MIDPPDTCACDEFDFLIVDYVNDSLVDESDDACIDQNWREQIAVVISETSHSWRDGTK